MRRSTLPLRALVLAGALAACPGTGHANNYGESLAWQFRTSTDRANQAVVLDQIERHRAGTYAAPVYTTTIEHQVNCSLAASALGNSEMQTATALSPNGTGAAASALANSAAMNLAGHGPSGSSDQANSGALSAVLNGDTSTQASGTAELALNSAQTNSGTQNASISGGSACTFQGRG